MPTLLISDTNVLIDLEESSLIAFLFRLPFEIAVSDMLFDLELRDKYGYLLEDGLKIISLTAESIQNIEILMTKSSKPSIIDYSALSLALQEGCPLLTGDRDLRNAAKSEGVEVHGTLWLVEQMIHSELIDQKQAKNCFESMKIRGRRLPWSEVDILLKKYEIAEVKY